MITYLMKFNSNIDIKEVVSLFKEKFENIKDRKDENLLEVTTDEYRILFFYGEKILFILPKRIKKITELELFVKIVRERKYVETTKAYFRITKESKFFKEILENYNTTTEAISQKNEQILINKISSNVEYTVLYDNDIDNFTVVVDDLNGNQDYIEMILSVFKAIENKI